MRGGRGGGGGGSGGVTRSVRVFFAPDEVLFVLPLTCKLSEWISSENEKINVKKKNHLKRCPPTGFLHSGFCRAARPRPRRRSKRTSKYTSRSVHNGVPGMCV